MLRHSVIDSVPSAVGLGVGGQCLCRPCTPRRWCWAWRSASRCPSTCRTGSRRCGCCTRAATATWPACAPTPWSTCRATSPRASWPRSSSSSPTHTSRRPNTSGASSTKRCSPSTPTSWPKGYVKNSYRLLPDFTESIAFSWIVSLVATVERTHFSSLLRVNQSGLVLPICGL